MKWIIVLAIMLLLLPSVTADTIRFASLEYPPFVSEEMDGNGFIYEIVEAAFNREGYDVIVDFMPWDDTFNMVKNGSYDAAPVAWYRTEREEWFAYSDPLISTKNSLCKLKGTDIRYNTVDDLKRYRIGTVKGYAYPADFLAANLTKLESANEMENFMNLIEGRVDLLFIGEAVLKYYDSLWEPDTVCFSPPFKIEPLYMIISKKNPDYLKIQSDFHSGLNQIITDGTYDVILQRRGYEEFGINYKEKGLFERHQKSIALTASIILAIIALITLWNILLKRQVTQKTEELKKELERRKKAERKTRKAYKDLKQLEYKKDVFMTTIKHHTKTPLTLIKGFGQLLNAPDVRKSKVKMDNYISIINRNADRLSDKIRDFIDIIELDLGKVDVNVRPISLKPIFDMTRRRFSSAISDKGITPIFSMEKGLKVNADPERLQQVLEYIIRNALESTEKGVISLKITKEKKNILFEISDTGKGIPKNMQEGIFDRFYRIEDPYKRKIGGANISLPLSKGLIELMKGRIWVESEPGKRSTFCFTLPKA